MGSGEAGKQVGRRAGGIMTAIFNLPSRLTGKGFEDVLMSGPINAQKEAYRDLLISHIVDPRKAVDLSKALDATKPLAYLTGQTFIRSGKEGVSQLFNSIENRNQDLREASDERVEEKAQQQPAQPTAAPVVDPNLGSKIDSIKSPMLDLELFEEESNPSIGRFDPALSPTIVPLDKDREIAMRTRGNLGGIASLA